MSLLIIFIAGVVICQIFIFRRTLGLISDLKKVLRGNYTALRNTTANYLLIRMEEADDPVSVDIRVAINTYLQKNVGAASDFNLIKDIVERNCDSLDSEISSQTPLPLYMGLMGTVAGIVIGMLTITINGGMAKLDNSVIEMLMSDVAVAMFASLVGITFTTISLWKSKQCKTVLEKNKNRFYTWIQTTLLPVISRSAVNAITMLQQNLTHFNESFRDTTDRMEKKLGDMGDVYEAQIEILEKIQKLDINKLASANVKILSTLDGSMDSLNRFAAYMDATTSYLTAVRELNDKLDEHMDRSEALGVVADFYKSQMKEIELRQDAVKSAVISVDDVMKSALASLSSNSEQGLKSLQEAFINQMHSMQEMMEKQTEQLSNQIKQMPRMVEKLEEISAIPAKIDKMIERLEKSDAEMGKQISRTLRDVGQRDGGRVITSAAGVPVAAAGGSRMPGWMRWCLILLLAIIAAATVGNLVMDIANYRKDVSSAEESIVAPSEADIEDADTVVVVEEVGEVIAVTDSLLENVGRKVDNLKPKADSQPGTNSPTEDNIKAARTRWDN